MCADAAHRFDNRFRNLNDVITKSRPQNKDEGPCMVLDAGDESGSDTIESQLERNRRSRAFRSSSPDNISVSKKSKHDSEDDVMIITPTFKADRKQIPSDSDDDDMAGRKQIPSDSDNDDMAGSSKAPHKGSVQDNGNDSDSDGEFVNLLSEIAKECLSDDVHFCDFANDNSKCYRNSLLWVLLSCDMLLEKIREHKKDASLPPCSEFDDFLLQLYDKCQQNKRISIDREFMNSNCLKVNATVIEKDTLNVLSYAEQSPTEYLHEMFVQRGNTTQVTKELMSYRLLNSIEKKNCDRIVTWRTSVHKKFIFSQSCKVVDETCFNNVSKFNIEASGFDMDAVTTQINIAMKLPDIWCIDAANNERPTFKHQFTLSAPQTNGHATLRRGVYQIIGLCKPQRKTPSLCRMYIQEQQMGLHGVFFNFLFKIFIFTLKTLTFFVTYSDRMTAVLVIII